MGAKRRSASKRRTPETLTSDVRTPATQAGAQALFFLAIAFVAAHEGFTGLGDPYRTPSLWGIVGAVCLVACARRADARLTDDFCLSFSSRARIGVLAAVAISAVLAIAGVGDRQHGLLAASTTDAALVGGLVFAAAALTWGGAASATRTLFGRAWIAVAAGAIMFTMAFFSGNLYADAAVFVASIAATIAAQRARSFAFPAIVFAYGAAGVPGAIVTTMLYVAIAAYRGRPM
ncbi:MAG TPA: hypothetical protein VKT51_03115 [Candidatus Eremiobacteraceae bacterium]|nr:hypothetical protein [Candidatus Eremiobacteraceae bacterium]